MVVVLDFGAQYSQLIAKRVREQKVYSKIFPYTITAKELKEIEDLEGIIFSGGPSSVNNSNAPQIDSKIFDLNIPILGICYGLQLLSKSFGGEVGKSKVKEYGYAHLNKLKDTTLLKGIKNNAKMWMSHSDSVKSLPKGMSLTASTENCKYAVLEDSVNNRYGVQFHPEVHHSQEVQIIIKNFVIDICKAKANWTMDNFIESNIKAIKKEVGNKRVLCGLSGGVDSSVAAALIHKAIGDNLTCVFVNTGLLRLNEEIKTLELFKDNLHFDVRYFDSEDLFLNALKGISEPETKRKIIGKEFITSFYDAARSIGKVDYLAQGTLYPDVIESKSVTGGPSSTIKSHHNVGGLPKDLKWKLLEPLKELFKDEVRLLGKALGLPDSVVYKQPFPGPGLGIRCIGKITKERLDTLRLADDILDQEVKKANLDAEIWQYLVDLLPVKSVGVQGDERTYKEVCSIRAVTSIDGMTADWYRFPYEVLQKVSSRICNEVEGINRVLYDISSKPPATIEWE